MADVNISKYRASVVRDGSKPASPGFVVSEGQDPVNPPGTNNYVPYTGATANVELGEYGLETGFVTLDTTPTNIPVDQGAIYWDDTRSTAALIMNGTLQHIGQDSFFYVKNSSGSTIPKGTCVGFAGTDGGSGHLLVTPFLANGSVPSTYFMGVTSEEIANGAFGQVMHFGELTGINTSGFTAGALLYASTTVAGGFQTTVPVAPNNIVLVAAAVNSKNNGAIVVRPTLGSNINSDEGVKITSPTTGDLLQLQAGGLWENKTLAQVIGSAYVPSTRTITINGTTQDLSANRTFNVGTVTSVGLSSATSGVTIGGSPVTGVGAFTLTIATASGSQNGLLSSTDWTTFNNKIGGTIATGQVAFGTAANTIGGDNGLFWDNTNKRLGIGSIIPISRIHISGNSAENTQYSAERVASAIGSSTQLLSLTAIGQIPTLTSSSANIRIIGDATWSSTSSPSRVQFETTSVGSTTVTERWRITSTGILQSNGAQTIQTSTGNLTLATAGGNGNVLLSPNGTGNVGVGITPSIWSSVNKAIQIGLGGAISSRTAVNNVQISSNYFRSASLVNTYINTDFASLYEQSSGSHFFYIAPSGTAGNAISFTQAMTLTSGGNLLVGTTTDNGARLQVSGGITALNSLVVTSSSNAALIASTNSTTGFSYLDFINSGASGRNYQIGVAGNGASSGYANNLYFDLVGVGNIMTLTSGRNVGIGTSSPQYLLTIGNAASGFTSAATIASSATGSSVTNLLLQNTSGSETASTGVNLNFSGVSNWLGRINAQFVGGTGLGNADMTFWTPSGGTISERMRITSGGNVGIGTASPTFRFDVETSNLTVGRFWSNASGKRNNILIQNSANWNYGVMGVVSATGSSNGDVYGLGYSASGSTAFTEVLNWTSTGNVGINSSSGFNQISSVETTLKIANTNAASLYLEVTGVRGYANFVGPGGNMVWYDYTAGADRMILFTNGNLRVGTGSDNGARLQVSGAVSTSSKYAWGTAINGTTGQIATDNTHNYFDYLGNLYFRGAVASNTLITFTSAGAATFSSSVTATGGVTIERASATASNPVRWSTGGTLDWYLGSSPLGTSTSDLSLYSYGTSSVVFNVARSTGAATFSSSVTANRYLINGSNGNSGQIIQQGDLLGTAATNLLLQSSSGNSIGFLTNGSNDFRMFINTSGNVGIGTASPGANLEVRAGSGANLRVRNNGSNNLLIQNYNDSDYYRNMQLAASTIQFLTGTEGGLSASEQMRITSGGNVLIGTTTDVGTRLYVDGAFRTGTLTAGTQTAAVDWRLGNARGGTATANALIRVQINGVLVDLIGNYV